MAKATAEDTEDLTVVYLGNRDVVVIQEDPDDPAVQTRVKPKDRPKKTVTIYTAHRSLSLMEIAVQLTDPTRGVWVNHSDAQAPAWIAVTGPFKDALAQILAAHWGGIEIRDAEPAPEHQGALAAGAAAADSTDEEA
jgi:hypothetical protein